MAASLNDSSFLQGDPTFGNRVFSSMITQCGNVATEAWSSTHLARKNFVAQVLNNPAAFKSLFINVASVNGTVLADATQGGTVALTAANVAAQAALVTDTDINNAVSAAMNNFIAGI